MGFALEDGDVRGDLYTADDRTKWKCTVVLHMRDYYSSAEFLTPRHAVKAAWMDGAYEGAKKQEDGTGISGYFLVVLDPFFAGPYPVMIKV